MLENICLNFAFASGLPRWPCIRVETTIRVVRTDPARISIEVWKPITVSIAAPRKNPTPFRAFLEPVRAATQR
ncbi:MAG TPA: hypothetical protein VMH33_09715 [Solirubrobacterales bacterium]|nr:hypothetical protein [Solirubrobacterales bacterium]